MTPPLWPAHTLPLRVRLAAEHILRQSCMMSSLRLLHSTLVYTAMMETMFNRSHITIIGGFFYNIAGNYFQAGQVTGLVCDRSTLDRMFHDLIAKNAHQDVLVSALGIILLSEQPVCCSQIAQMIERSPNDILSTLCLVPSLFKPGSLVLINSPIHTSDECQELGNFLFEPARSGELSCDKAAVHAVFARWCLSNENELPRDIKYARTHWAHHVCCSVPSTSLIDDLRVSQLPFALSSHKSLPKVIDWLKGIPQSFRDSDLVSKLEKHHSEMEARLATTGVQLQSIAGIVNTVFTSTDHLANTDSPYVSTMDAGGTHTAVSV